MKSKAQNGPTSSDTGHIDQIVDEYRDAALQYAEATEAGDFTRANPAVDRIVQSVRALDLLGSDARLRLQKLLGDANLHVVVWAATHLLKCDPVGAEEKLVEVSTGRTMASITARSILYEWRSGTLRPTE